MSKNICILYFWETKIKFIKTNKQTLSLSMAIKNDFENDKNKKKKIEEMQAK